MGPRAFMSPRLLQILPAELHFGYVGRPERSASGEGYPVAHAHEQEHVEGEDADIPKSAHFFPAKFRPQSFAGVLDYDETAATVVIASRVTGAVSSQYGSTRSSTRRCCALLALQSSIRGGPRRPMNRWP